MSSSRKNIERQNLTAQIGAEIAEELMTGVLLPGQPLILRKLAEQFGVSQTPVREALLQLVSEGALDMSPSRSIQVPQPSIKKLHELRELRILIECYAGRAAALHTTDATIQELELIHTNMIDSLRRRAHNETLQLNKDFHFLLYEQSGLPTTIAVIRQLWMQMAPYLNYIYSPHPPARDTELIDHPHTIILDGLKKKDPDRVHEGVEKDLRHLQEHLDNNLASLGQ